MLLLILFVLQSNLCLVSCLFSPLSSLSQTSSTHFSSLKIRYSRHEVINQRKEITKIYSIASRNAKKVDGTVQSSVIPLGELTIGVLKEICSNEKRVAQTPESVQELVEKGIKVFVERGAGKESLISDEAFAAAGAKIVSRSEALQCDIVVKVQPPTMSEVKGMKKGNALLSFMQPGTNKDLLDAMQRRGMTVFALDFVPRQVREAQLVDAFTSQATVSGYRAVIEALHAYPRMVRWQVVVGGATVIPPAKVLVLGAGVAGLSAVATCCALEMDVAVYDSRASHRTQVEALSAEFIQIDSPAILDSSSSNDDNEDMIADNLARYVASSDIVICTVLPTLVGNSLRVPKLIKKETIQSMRSGSVIVDLVCGTSGGGNCELSQSDKLEVKEWEDTKVTIIGYSDLPSRASATASMLLANNINRFILLNTAVVKSGSGNLAEPVFSIRYDDEIVSPMVILEKGEWKRSL